MFRRALQICTSYPSRAALRTSASTGTTTSAVISEPEDPLKDLVDLLSSENEISLTEQRTIPPFASICSVADLEKLARKNVQRFSLSDYLSILKAASSLFKDRKTARDFVEKCGRASNDADIAEMAVNDDLIAFLTVLLDLDLKEEPLFRSFERRLLENIDEADFSISAVVPFLIASHRAGYVWPEEVNLVIQEVLTSQIRHIDSANILISILSHWNLEDKKVSQAAVEKTVELLGIRDKKLLPVLSARITDHQTTLSVRQLGSLAASCAKLSYFDVRVQRRLAKDLLVDVNNIDSWADVSSLVNSFSRLRFGEMTAWNALARWVNNHVDSAPLESLSIVISGMARNGIEECRPAALELSKRVRPESANSENAWLSTVYSLAYFRALSPILVESVLNKDFVAQLLNSSTSLGERLFKALKLMQINACAQVDLESAYNGPSLELSDLESFIKFDDETTRLARLIKYGKKEIEACNQFLSGVVFKIGSPSTHISPSCIDKVGVLVDAQIVCEPGSTRLVAINKWGDSVPRPIFFFGWGQTRQVSTDTVRSEENTLLGGDQLALRLLRRKGIKPIVVLYSDLLPLSSTAEKLQFLKKKILDSA
ncbi:hypothetical protein KIN20_034950 [Parelaphostrongylus tenuis]|uniref:RAP domain-containing protein n=1 Tax=Parelaphostrongylus tenuis TaxID=148309 RepID=A0AAD5RDE4_PARTN|nr:hypothetical protein KIN20_034950 [Parelaphostrongylus tenuis]